MRKSSTVPGNPGDGRSGLFDREEADRPERRTAIIAIELAKYNIDIVALCETRFSESGSLNDLEYSFFWIGKPEREGREAGVGFAIKKYIYTKLTEMPQPNATKAQQAKTSKPTKLNTANLSTTSHKESFEQEMDSDVAQWEEKEKATP
ncbi:hypothetical protein NP493_1627g01054 [Ridgeia piscesae]|uniref:Uncharacterized protein n=1 Tax=Ridgeia piscesae TaxID=27915 RepID=A0AAD9JWU0_RIDPI|nr:hypothetical protein NP493_1627g01054 [Ridgeia piscesae]